MKKIVIFSTCQAVENLFAILKASQMWTFSGYAMNFPHYFEYVVFENF